MAPTIEELETLFNANPSLDASLQDFEPGSSELSPSPRFGYPSHHSGFRSDSDSEIAGSEAPSNGRCSPPAWRREASGHRSSGFWTRQHKLLGKHNRGSREDSPELGSDIEYESAEEGDNDATLEAAVRTRLPTGSLSPEKRRSPSPDPYPAGSKEFANKFGSIKVEEDAKEPIVPLDENPNNFIRFAVRAEVQHKTDPFEAIISLIRHRYNTITRSRWSFLSSTAIALLSFLLLLAGLAKAFEPLIFYSENGITQIGDLQLTGEAVWDLGESVRSTNMTSAPIIVKELDDLSESLKTLAVELTRFFANVDGDVDGILIVMDWARRELHQLQLTQPSHLTTAFDNIHSALSKWGVLESSLGSPTALGQITTSLFGPSISPTHTCHAPTHIQRRTHTLFSALRPIREYRSAILNLARTVIRETSKQEEMQDDLLSSLWTKLLGPNSHRLEKYESNKKLLATIRSKTVQNKSILMQHNGKLLTLKANLESLRRKLVSPLLRANGSTLGIEEQIRGLEEVGGYLGGVRERQRSKLMEMIYGAGTRGPRFGIGGGEIEARWQR
ncbi:hypothetical protein B0O99DRAFT_649218 [Bisporella sp. PMI_857]|nr:hypothetical protein B0O99DRAFT_649647 [Bisporella sp. PMI_857]KAH8600414.1 hypothetical protein B0O99DRAFT_649218 [Bisporella sp. PMI_857]